MVSWTGVFMWSMSTALASAGTTSPLNAVGKRLILMELRYFMFLDMNNPVTTLFTKEKGRSLKMKGIISISTLSADYSKQTAETSTVGVKCWKSVGKVSEKYQNCKGIFGSQQRLSSAKIETSRTWFYKLPASLKVLNGLRAVSGTQVTQALVWFPRRFQCPQVGPRGSYLESLAGLKFIISKEKAKCHHKTNLSLLHERCAAGKNGGTAKKSKLPMTFLSKAKKAVS